MLASCVRIFREVEANFVCRVPPVFDLLPPLSLSPLSSLGASGFVAAGVVESSFLQHETARGLGTNTERGPADDCPTDHRESFPSEFRIDRRESPGVAP